jgi:ankyrin repeat protein
MIVLAILGFHAWRRFSTQEARAPEQKNTEDEPKQESSRKHQASTESSTSNSTLDFNAVVKAMNSGNEDDLNQLLNRSVNACDEISCCTALHAAAHSNCLPAAKALLSRGADINVRDVWDETPLHFASRAGHVELCNLLLESGAELNTINAQDWTPLLVAAEAGKEEVCNVLLDHGAHTGGLDEEDVPPLLLRLLQCRILAGLTAS